MSAANPAAAKRSPNGASCSSRVDAKPCAMTTHGTGTGRSSGR